MRENFFARKYYIDDPYKQLARTEYNKYKKEKSCLKN